MDLYDRCPGCHRGCYLSNPGCHVGRNMAWDLMYGGNNGYMENARGDWDPWGWDQPRRDGYGADPGRPHWENGHSFSFDQPRHEVHEWSDVRPEHRMRQEHFDEWPPDHPWDPQDRRPPFGSRPPRAPFDDHEHGRGHGRGMRHAPMGAPDDEFLIHSFQHCAHLLVHRQSKEHASSRAVMALQRRGQDGMSQRELAESLDIRSASVSELLTKMEDEELITRRHDPADKRVILIELTDKGHAEANRVAERRKEANKNLFALLSDEEKEQLKVILDKLTHFWHKEFEREERR